MFVETFRVLVFLLLQFWKIRKLLFTVHYIRREELFVGSCGRKVTTAKMADLDHLQQHHFLYSWHQRHGDIRAAAIDRKILISKGVVSFAEIEDSKRAKSCAKEVSTTPPKDMTKTMSVDDIICDMVLMPQPLYRPTERVALVSISEECTEYRSMRIAAQANSRILCFLMGHTNGVGDGSWARDGNDTTPVIKRFTVCCFLCNPVRSARKVVIYDPRKNTPSRERPGSLIHQFIASIGDGFSYPVMHTNGRLKSNCSEQAMYNKCVSFLSKCATFTDLMHGSLMEKLDRRYIPEEQRSAAMVWAKMEGSTAWDSWIRIHWPYYSTNG